MEREILRRRPPILTLGNFCRDLTTYLVTNEAQARTTKVSLVTYNRVGEGLLGSHDSTGGLTLDLYQGRLDVSSLTAKRSAQLVFGDEAEGYRPNLTLEEVESFFGEVKLGLIRRIMADDRASEVVVVYGGEGEKFQMALRLVEDVSSLARGLGKKDRMKYFLLTCNCGLAGKVKESALLYANGGLECLIYNPLGSCGGFHDLQSIADVLMTGV